MAVTIARTDWIDDDGSGTTGTVINNAEKTALYVQIDGALAKVAQLAGGNSFTGNQTINGSLTGTSPVAFVGAGVSLSVRNTTSATNAAGLLYVGNDADPNLTIIQSLSSTWSPVGTWAVANGSMLYASGAGGLALLAGASAGSVRFYSGGQAERMRIAATGEVLVNTTTNLPSAQLMVAVDSVGHPIGVGVLSLNAANNVFFCAFYNSAGATAGYINQTGATTVNYATSSDARLKDDDGRASDLAALRGVVVHDFTWKADGIRDRGVFAQEAHDLYPRAVSKGTDDLTDSGDLKSPWMTDYSKFVPDLIVGWQQHEAELAALRAELKGRH